MLCWKRGRLSLNPTEGHTSFLEKGMAGTYSGPGKDPWSEGICLSFYFHICFPAENEVTLLNRVVVETANTADR